MKRLKKGDPVIVIAGNNKGDEGTLEAIKGQKSYSERCQHEKEACER